MAENLYPRVAGNLQNTLKALFGDVPIAIHVNGQVMKDIITYAEDSEMYKNGFVLVEKQNGERLTYHIEEVAVDFDAKKIE